MSDDFPTGFIFPHPITDHQACLFRISLTDALARLGVSPDELTRWHGRGWVSFDANTSESLDEFDDPKIFEIQIVRDIARSGLTDSQIEVLLSRLMKPYAYDPETIAFSFRHGWLQAAPVEIPDPSEIIEEHLDEWIAGCDEATLKELRYKISEALTLCAESEPDNQYPEPIES